MIADSIRTDAYAHALRQTVGPDSVVLDIGTGSGIFALLACRFGARRVYAVEPSEAIQIAKEIAAANGYAECIEFIQDVSTQLRLPEQADVIVSDIHGILPFFEQALPSTIDARDRMLAPGGVLIPQYETVWAAVVGAPELYREYETPWDHNAYGLDMSAARQCVTNTFRKARVTPEQLLVKPQSWASLDYATLKTTDVKGEVAWTAERAATAHGLVLWFDSTLAQGIGFSNAPDAPELIYGSAFFPWLEPVTLAVGDEISVTLQAKLVDGDYIWRWDTCVLDHGRPEQIRAHFKQSTFYGTPIPANVHKLAASHVPTLNEHGEADRFILALMDGETSQGEIARRVSDRFPTRFAKRQDALTRVGELSLRYSR